MCFTIQTNTVAICMYFVNIIYIYVYFFYFSEFSNIYIPITMDNVLKKAIREEIENYKNHEADLAHEADANEQIPGK